MEDQIMQQLTRSSKPFGAAIARQRKAKGLTQSSLASKVNTRQATISDLENGKGGTRLDIVFAILAALDLDIALQARSSDKSKMSDIF